MRTQHVVEVEGLTKRYGPHRGIEDVTFTVAPGEVFGFLGPNGAGKTTTIRLLMGFLRPSGGSARVGGLDCWSESVDVHRLVGYLPGELSLDGGLTGGQILEYFGHLRGGVERGYLARLVERLALDPSRTFRQYSRGNKQKVGLIQAFMHRPSLLILDEPTGGLDPLNQHEFERLVAEVRAEGRTVFLSSHVLSEVERLCERVAIIREGRLVRLDTVRAVRDIKRFEVEVRFGEPAAVEAFRTLPGVERVESHDGGRTLRLVVRGELDPVVKVAARHHVVSLASREPSLEEMFRRVYAEDGVANREVVRAV